MEMVTVQETQVPIHLMHNLIQHLNTLTSQSAKLTFLSMLLLSGNLFDRQKVTDYFDQLSTCIFKIVIYFSNLFYEF